MKRACFVEFLQSYNQKPYSKKNPDAMNTKNKPYAPKFAIKNTAKDKAAIKTVSLQVAVTRPDLQNTIRKAFDLAKGGGRELDLAFSL
jgi:3-hydroxyisobutyrate dehydrogenase-like beta-hydroxyacid dehydrogenase